MKSILVLRLSSMGDVLLTLPVMQGILDNNPDVQLVFVTRKKFIPYFTGIARIKLVSFDPDGEHKGFRGLFHLYKELKGYPFQKVVDLHGILRTYVLDLCLILSGHQVYRVKKHRMLRRRILSKKEFSLSAPHATDRYLDVFKEAGFIGGVSTVSFKQLQTVRNKVVAGNRVIRVGLAPISKHPTKNWGIQNFSELTTLLRQKFTLQIHLFGGPEDFSLLESLSAPDVFNHAGQSDPAGEIELIGSMDVFVSMDSANMHLAALAGVPVVSVWGATDPRIGFSPLFQPADRSLQASQEEAYCRPCSVYGEKPCIRTDLPMVCMSSIKPERVLNKIIEIIQSAGIN